VSDQGVVYDLGYKPHDGPRLGRRAAVSATVRDGLRRMFGIRRRARKKILPWLLFAIALLPAIVVVGLVFLTSMIATGDLVETPFASHAAYFDLAGSTVFLFTALSGPELLIPDRVDGVLAVYSSRPMTILDYLGARAAALSLGVAGFLLVPQLLLYIAFAALGGDGFAGELIGNAGQLVRVIAATVVYIVAYGAPAFLVAAYAKRLAPATGIYLAIMFVSTGISAALAESGSQWAAVGAIASHPDAVRDWIFDRGSQSVPAQAGLDPWVSLAVILGIAIATITVAVRRYRRLL
jgi:ABC-2 type transport system permease protein